LPGSQGPGNHLSVDGVFGTETLLKTFDPRQSMYVFKLVMKWLFAAIFLMAGTLHWLRPEFFVKVMPPYLPWHLELVYISGVFEIVLGVLLLIPKCQVLAAWGLVALLIAVFPANVHMALHASDYRDFPASAIWLRLPLQGVLIAWAYWFTRR
jgi:uncharacterized membrane protein